MIVTRINSSELRAKLDSFVKQGKTRDLLEAAWGVMLGSITRTFRDQGYPAGSWKPLAPSTIAGRRRGRGSGGIKILRDSGNLFNSITPEYARSRLIIGTNLKYARIQQEGGVAGRKPPFKKKNGKRPTIPARPYLVFRKEDPDRMARAVEAILNKAIRNAGLGRRQ